MLIVDGNDADKVREMLTSDIEQLSTRHDDVASMYEKASAAAPAFGMVGTLIGLINMLVNMDPESGSSTIGKDMGTALITTLSLIHIYERAQTIALVLSHVDPDKAAAVLEELPPKKKLRVVEDIARMDSASPNAVKMIEDELQKKFSSIVVTENIQIGGLDHIAAIMNNLERSSEKAIFDGLEVKDSGLAEEIRKRMFVFEDIVHMDDRSEMCIRDRCYRNKQIKGGSV